MGEKISQDFLSSLKKSRHMKKYNIDVIFSTIWRPGLLVFLIYLFVVLIVTYPLILSPTTHILGDGGDGPIFVWNSWWFGEAFLSKDVDLAYTNYLNYPQGLDILFHTHTYVHDAVISAISPITGRILAFNITTWLFIAFTALGGYMLASVIAKNRYAGFIAGLIIGFAPPLIVRGLGHFNLLAAWVVPWFFYYLYKSLIGRNWKFGLGAGIIAALAIWNGFHYPLFIIIFSVLVLFFWAIFSYRNFFSLDMMITLGVIIIVSIVLSLPILIQYINAAANGLLPEKPPLEDYVQFSADLSRFIIPSFLHPVLGHLAYNIKSTFSKWGGGIENTVFLGYTTVLMGVAGVMTSWRRNVKSKRIILEHPAFWLVWSLLAILLSLGPFLTISGQQQFSFIGNNKIPLLYNWLWHVPIFGGLRVPSRFVVMAMIGLSVLSALFISRLFENYVKRKVTKKIITIVISGIIIFEFMPIPFPINNLEPPPVYTIQSIDYQGTVLHLPLGLKSGFQKIGDHQSLDQYYQTLYERPQVGGYISRIPIDYFNKIESRPVISFFMYFPLQVPWKLDYSAYDPLEALEEMKESNIQTIVINKQYYFSKYNRGILDILDKYINFVLKGEKIYHDNEYSVYRISLNRSEKKENLKPLVLPMIITLNLGETVENTLLPKRVALELQKTTNSDIGIIHNSSFRDGVPEGEVNELDVLKTYPWGDYVVIAEISLKTVEILKADSRLTLYDAGCASVSCKIAFPSYLLESYKELNYENLYNYTILDKKIIDLLLESYSVRLNETTI